MPVSDLPHARPAGQRRALRLLVLLAPLLLLLSQLRLLPQDQGVLLEVAGQPVDAAGRLHGAWQQLSRHCGAVQRWPAGSVRWLEAQQALAAHSPPSSLAARPLQLLALPAGEAGEAGEAGAAGEAEWLLAEVLWDGAAVPAGAAPLDPAIVPLQRVQGRLQVVTAGVWSGDTGPWAAPVFIRRWLQRQVPALPVALALCLDPQWPAFASSGGLTAPAR